MAAAGTTQTLFPSVKHLGILLSGNLRQDIEFKSQEPVDNGLERGNDDLFEYIILEISWPD